MKLEVALEKLMSSMKRKWWISLTNISELFWQSIHAESFNLEQESWSQGTSSWLVLTLLIVRAIKTSSFPKYTSILASTGSLPTTSMFKNQQLLRNIDQRRSGSTERFMTTRYSNSRRKWMILASFPWSEIFLIWIRRKRHFLFTDIQSQNTTWKTRSQLVSNSMGLQELEIFWTSIQKLATWCIESQRRPDKAGPQSSWYRITTGW